MSVPPLEQKRNRRDTSRNVALLGLTVLIALFAVLNLRSVKVDWLLKSTRIPLIIVIAISVLLGMALTWLGDRVNTRRQRGRPGTRS
jgi:uncharacterized integral membrane protein